MNRSSRILFAATAAAAALAVGVPAAAADDAQPPGRPSDATGIVKKCIPALGFAAGVVTATDTDALVIDVKLTGKLGALLVGEEMTVDVVARTRFFKNGARAFSDDVEIDDRIAIRILKCRGERLVADGMKAAIVTDFGPGATGDAKVAAEAADESQPDAALLAALGRPVLRIVRGLFPGQGAGPLRGQGQGQGFGQGQGPLAGQAERRGRGMGPEPSQGNGGDRGNGPGQASNGWASVARQVARDARDGTAGLGICVFGRDYTGWRPCIAPRSPSTWVRCAATCGGCSRCSADPSCGLSSRRMRTGTVPCRPPQRH